MDLPTAMQSLRWLRGLYLGNSLLMAIFPMGVLISIVSNVIGLRLSDLLIGLGLYVFGLVEFVHYFVFKINMRPGEFRLALRRKRPVPARLLREYKRAEQCVYSNRRPEVMR
jgi:hypothetical protein